MKLLLVILLCVALVSCQDFEFINPASGGDAGEYSQNPTFVLGSVINIQWTGPEDKKIDMVLYQDVPEAAFEYVFSGKTNESSFRWNVGTTKPLSKSPVFFFQIFVSGDTGPSAGSHYFNLTRGNFGGNDDTTTTSSSSTSTTPAPTTSSTTVPADSATTTPASSATSQSQNDGGLSTGAKVGMGVGIPIAIILGIAAGWFIFGRKKKSVDTVESSPAPAYAPPHEGHYAPNAMSEQSGNGLYKPPNLSPNPTPSEIYTPPTEPVEMPSNPSTQRY